MKPPKHNPDWVIIGKIGRAIGLDGLLAFNSFSEIPNTKSFFIFDDRNNAWNEIDLTIIFGNKDKIKITNINNPEQARVYVNKYIAIKRSDLPELEPGEFYWHDLISMQVINQNNELIGHVEEIKDFGSQPNLIVIGNKKQTIIPMLDDVIISTNYSDNIIKVNWDLELD